MKDVRPTSSKVLLALFSILGGLEGRSFLDLFAGTGRVGIEAMRRGAAPVVMAEVLKDRAVNIERAIQEDFSLSHCTPEVIVLSLELRRAIAWLVKRECLFDVIFADPPYDEGWGASLLKAKNLDKILKPGGVIVAEHASRETLDVPPAWTVRDSRVYGETKLTFLHKTGGIAS